MLTSLIWVNCLAATGSPTCRRLQAYLSACRQIPMHAPTVFQITMRRLWRIVVSTPVLQEVAPGKMDEGSTLTVWKSISAFWTTLKQYLLGIFRAESPCELTYKRAPMISSLSPCFAFPKTIKQSLTPLPIHLLLPLRIQLSPSLLKVVPSLVELDPTSRSVRAHPHIFRKCMRSGRRACWWLEPRRAMLLAQRGS